MENETNPREFILLEFSDIRNLQFLHFAVFFSIYVVALIGNFLIITTVAQNHQLHSPMYFFLVNLSFIDICYISTTIPKSMANSLINSRLISYAGCVSQVFLVTTFAPADMAFLTAMAYDRYVAICHPLRYNLIMNWSICFQMAAASWVTGIINAVVQTVHTCKLHFCQSNSIQQYFCDIPQLLLISCTDTTINKQILLAVAFSFGSFCILSIFVSYGFILYAVFKMQSIKSRHKAFSTCTPHLTIFSLFAITVMFSYLRPKVLSSPLVDLLASLLYTILPPVFNPIIYSLRNREIHVAVLKMSKERLGFCMVNT